MLSTATVSPKAFVTAASSRSAARLMAALGLTRGIRQVACQGWKTARFESYIIEEDCLFWMELVRFMPAMRFIEPHRICAGQRSPLPKSCRQSPPHVEERDPLPL